MTTPKKPLQPSTNKADGKQHDIEDKAWYRAPIIWLGAFIGALIIFGYTQLIIVSHQNAVDRPPLPQNDSQEITHIFGVPLQPQEADKPQHNAADNGTER